MTWEIINLDAAITIYVRLYIAFRFFNIYSTSFTISEQVFLARLQSPIKTRNK
jgi:hypothetical protein